MNINDIIIAPIITEKSSKQLGENVYTFKVHPLAKKADIKRAIEVIFAKSGAKVLKVNIVRVKSKPKRMGKYEGFKSKYKKALIKLSAGSIPIYGSQGIENTDAEGKTKPKKGINIINTEKILNEGNKGK